MSLMPNRTPPLHWAAYGPVTSRQATLYNCYLYGGAYFRLSDVPFAGLSPSTAKECHFLLPTLAYSP